MEAKLDMKISHKSIQSMLNDGKTITIEIDKLELVKHLESDFERTARLLAEKTKKSSDILMWLSEWAKTDEKKNIK